MTVKYRNFEYYFKYITECNTKVLIVSEYHAFMIFYVVLVRIYTTFVQIFILIKITSCFKFILPGVNTLKTLYIRQCFLRQSTEQ